MAARRAFCGLLASVASTTAPLGAQHRHSMDSTRTVAIGGMGVGVYSYVTPGALKAPVSEAYLTQPMAFATARAFQGRLVAHLTINAEGATLQRGEVNPGSYGEGYIDRRHPHTWVHEAMIGTRLRAGPVAWSVLAGKGFVPYGTDDPMVRPFVKYPVNHHHAQLLERAMVTGAVRWRGASLEAARFNGDEPKGTTDWPNRDRLWDSWSARATFVPARGIELSASAAEVQSPEYAPGNGLDQSKRAASLRLWRPQGRLRYALVEGARTREYSDDRLAFTFGTVLAEAEGVAGDAVVAVRVEQTTRPEEERTRSFYRTIRPLLDFNILGRTRWTNLTVNLSHRGWGRGAVMGRPFVEVGYHVPRATLRPTPLDPVQVFGSRQVWSTSVGIRVHAGRMRERFGRYQD